MNSLPEGFSDDISGTVTTSSILLSPFSAASPPLTTVSMSIPGLDSFLNRLFTSSRK